MTEEEIRAVVATARDYGFKVAAHAHGAEGIKRAMRGGVDTIEHGTFMDDEGMKLMKEHGTYLRAHLLRRALGVRPGAGSELLSADRASQGAAGAVRRSSRRFARAYKAGVKILFGTDTGVGKHGDNAREFRAHGRRRHAADGGHSRCDLSVPAKFLESRRPDGQHRRGQAR